MDSTSMKKGTETIRVPEMLPPGSLGRESRTDPRQYLSQYQVSTIPDLPEEEMIFRRPRCCPYRTLLREDRFLFLSAS
ncbi:hypothetical protein VTO42DRAFT_7058 [Malbranchea cinnamomea]